MDWDFEEALDYYRRQGAPSDQNALVSLLKEIQQESGGTLNMEALGRVAESYGLRESFLLAIIKRIGSLKLDNTHCLEICGGPACSKRAKLDRFVRSTYGPSPENFTVKHVNCLRMCGKGPNVRWDGKLYSGVDEALLRSLIDSAK